MKYLFTVLFVTLFSIASYSQNYKEVKIHIQTLQDITELQNLGLEFDHPQITKDNSIIVFLDEDDYSKQPKLSASEKAEIIQKSKDNYGVEGFGFGSMGGFYTLAEVVSKLDSMRQLYPNLITSKVSIGNTIENQIG